MNELLQKLLEAEVLSEETKTELEEAFQTQLDEAIETAKANAAADVRAELTEQWVTERDNLIEAVDMKVGEYLTQEVEELKEDIERFRDLEAEYAEKLVEAKASMSGEVQDDLEELVEKIDAFLEMRLTAEFQELREDIEVVRQNDFGRRIFEAVQNEFAANYADEESAEVSLRETEERLEEATEALAEAERRLADMERSDKMASVLSPLSGKQREVMEAILRNVATENLEEGYKTFIGRVITETEETSEKEGEVLTEGDSLEEDLDENSGVVKTGDEEVVTESVEDEVSSSELDKWRTLAGINK